MTPSSLMLVAIFLWLIVAPLLLAFWIVFNRVINTLEASQLRGFEIVQLAHTSIAESTAATSRAVGEAVSVALLPPPLPPPTSQQAVQEVLERYGMAEGGKIEGDVDDSDPTDAFIAMGPRLDAEAVDFSIAGVTGIPGLVLGGN